MEQLNTPHHSGKLTRWGLALQELELDIQYHPEKINSRADTMSRSPVSLEPDENSDGQVQQVIAAVQPPVLSAQRGECN